MVFPVSQIQRIGLFLNINPSVYKIQTKASDSIDISQLPKVFYDVCISDLQDAANVVYCLRVFNLIF